jgi:hypothetical protein
MPDFNFSFLSSLGRDVRGDGSEGSALGGAARGFVHGTADAGDDLHFITFLADGTSLRGAVLGSVKGNKNIMSSLASALQTDSKTVMNDMKLVINDVTDIFETRPLKPSEQGPAGSRLSNGKLIRNADGSFSTAEQASWPSRVLTSMKNNPGKTFFGLATVTLIAVAGAALGCTDGVTVDIKTISIVPNTSNTQIDVTYTPPTSAGCVAGMFRPRPHDTFTFNGTTSTPLLDSMGACEVIKVISESSVRLNLPQQITSVGDNIHWGQMTCQSSFEHQLAGFTSDIITTIVAVGTSALPAVLQGFCDALPAVCAPFQNFPGWLAIVCGILCCGLCAILLVFFMKK